MAEKKVSTNFKVRGIASYPKTNKPVKYDQASKRSVNDPDGSYELTIIIDSDQAEKIDKQLRAFATSKGVKKIKNMPLSEQTDSDGNETGKWLLRTKQYGKNKDGSVKRILHVDSKTKPLGKDFVLTSGSEVNVFVYPTVYETLGGGVRVNIDSIQVVKYAEFVGNNPFEVVEGGWTADEDEENETEFEDVSEEEEDATDF